MDSVDDWPPAPLLGTERLSLEPLRIDHANEMAPLLDDPRYTISPVDAPGRRTNFESATAST